RFFGHASHHLPPVWCTRNIPDWQRDHFPRRASRLSHYANRFGCSSTGLAHRDKPLAHPAARSRQCSPNLSAVLSTEQPRNREVRDVGRLVLDPVLAGAARDLPRPVASPAQNRQAPGGSTPRDLPTREPLAQQG